LQPTEVEQISKLIYCRRWEGMLARFPFRIHNFDRKMYLRARLAHESSAEK
jgi:hypothetical protein